MVQPVNQGTINRLRGSVSVISIPSLNVTPGYLGKEMITISPQGEVTHQIPSATGIITSPEPYQIVDVSIHVLRTNGLGDRYKKQLELNSVLGDIVVRGDTSSFSDYNITNVSIKSVDAIKMNGEDAGWMVHLSGSYLINSSLYTV